MTTDYTDGTDSKSLSVSPVKSVIKLLLCLGLFSAVMPLAALAQRGEFLEDGLLKNGQLVEELVADVVLDEITEFFDRV